MKKISSLFLLILTATMAFVIPANSYADPQLDSLLNIANHARDSLSITISQITNVSSGIRQLYAQGSNETDALAQAASQQDVASAKQHFLAAMKYFKETNDMINSLNSTQSNDQQKAQMEQLQGELVRLENMGRLLKSIALQNQVDINFTSFDQMLQTANQDIQSGNLDDASTQVQSANEFIVSTHDSINKAAQEQVSQRAKVFTENQIAQLNNSTQASSVPQSNTPQPNSTVSSSPVQQSGPQNAAPNIPAPSLPIVNGSNVTMSNNPQEMVAQLKTLVAEGKVDQAINLIKIIQAYQKAKLAEKSLEAPAVPTPTVPAANATVPTPVPTPQGPPANVTVPRPATPPVPPEKVTVPTPPVIPGNVTVPSNNTLPVPPVIPGNTTLSNNTESIHGHQPNSDHTVGPESHGKNNDNGGGHDKTRQEHGNHHYYYG